MRKNFASVVILGATAALSLSSVSPALAAAKYPPTISKVIVNNSNFVVGVPKGKFETYKGVASILKFTIKLKPNVTEVLTVKGLGTNEARKTVPTTIKNPDGTTTKIPNLVVDKNGNITSDGIAFKKAGTYVVTFKLPNGTTKVTTFIVK